MRQQLVKRLAALMVLGFSLALLHADVNDVKLNEILASNTRLTNANGSLSDLVEMYNAGATAVNLQGCSLSDSNNFPRRYTFPPGSTIGPNSYLVLTFDSGRTNFQNNVPFGIKASGGFLYFYSSTDPFTPVSQIEYGLQIPDFSLGCVPEGTTNWMLTTPTLGGPNVAVELGSRSVIKVNEWLVSGGNDYLELYNPTNRPIAIGGAFLSDTLMNLTKFRIADLSFIGTGVISGFLKFDCDSSTNKYPADHTNFGLSDNETVAFTDVNGFNIDFPIGNYGNQKSGISQGRLPDGSPNLVFFPKINDYSTMSPGTPNFLILTNLYVNEILTHTDPPLEDAVEIVNRVSTNVNISGWWLSNSRLTPKKYLIPNGPALTPGGFRVIYEGVNASTGFNSSNAAAEPFTFNAAHGDQVVLSETDGNGNLTGYILYEEFEAAANGVSFGYYKTSVSNDYKFVAMAELRFGATDPNSIQEFRAGTGATNSYPKIGPIVINEVMFAPAKTVYFTNGVPTNDENPEEEYIELRNITSDTIPLYDPLYPTNHWKLQKAVDFVFPLANLGPNQFCLIVGFNPQTNAAALANFRSRFGVSNDVPIFGPWTGRLANGGDAIELYKPDPVQLPPHPDAGFVPYVRVDKVNYSSSPPWPGGANQTGSSIQRKNSLLFGNDPINWGVSPPTPGRATSSALQDTDGDGMPDSWETAHGFLPNNPTDADDDPDGDGVTNLAEYVGGTNPRDASSLLRVLDLVPSTGTNVPASIRFLAYSNTTYTVEYRNSTLPSSTWQKLRDVPLANFTRLVEVADTNAFKKADRYYRVVAPATN